MAHASKGQHIELEVCAPATPPVLTPQAWRLLGQLIVDTAPATPRPRSDADRLAS